MFKNLFKVKRIKLKLVRHHHGHNAHVSNSVLLSFILCIILVVTGNRMESWSVNAVPALFASTLPCATGTNRISISGSIRTVSNRERRAASTTTARIRRIGNEYHNRSSMTHLLPLYSETTSSSSGSSSSSSSSTQQNQSNKKSEECDDIVILGGGFGGLNTALTLDALPWDDRQYTNYNKDQKLKKRPKIKLIDNKERFIFLPLLYELCVGDAELDEVAPTFESLLQNNPNIEFIQSDVQGIDIDNNQVHLTTTTAAAATSTTRTSSSASTVTTTDVVEKNKNKKNVIPYKSLIVSTGSSINLSYIKGASTFALPFYTVQHCYELRKQLDILDIYIQQQQQQKQTEEGKPKDVSIVIVGGGYSGVELALNIKERLNSSSSSNTRNNDTATSNVKVTLLHRGDEVLQYANEYNKRNGQKRLFDAGVNICTGQSVVEVLPPSSTTATTAVGTTLTTAELKYKCRVVTTDTSLDADLLLWTAGAMAKNEQRDILNSKLPRDSKGRIITNQYLQVKNVPNVFALGDCSRTKKIPYPATAAVAMQQAPVVAWNVFSSTIRQNLIKDGGIYSNYAGVRNKKDLDPLPFEYLDLGQMMTLGGDDATISSLSGAFEIDGSIASVARRLIYAARMPTVQQALTAAISSTNKRLEKNSLKKVNKIIDWK